jgi:hypothetical protein
MSPGQLFVLCNLAVLPAWGLLVVAPGWRWTRSIAAYVTPAALALLYLGVMVTHFAPSDGGFGSLDQLASTYHNAWLLLAGWLHLLAIDLFLGAWQVRDAQRLGISHAYVIPCLALTFVIGPVGLAVYFGVRFAMVRKLPQLEERLPAQRPHGASSPGR